VRSGHQNKLIEEFPLVTELDPAQELLAKATPEARPLIEDARLLIKRVIPQATEQVHMGWGVINYLAGSKTSDMVVAIAPHWTYINIQFADGAHLPDPGNKLEGTGKNMRHVKIRDNEDLQSPDVRALLMEAAKKRGL
jgi:hypothetical protein